MNFPAPIVLVASLTLLTACGGSGGGGEPFVPEAPDSTDSDPITPDSPLDGVWESGCFEAMSPALSRRYVVSIADSLFTFVDTTYGDSLCDEESAQREIDTTGDFSEQLPEDGQRIEDGIPIDLSVDQVTLTPRQSVVAASYNELMLCNVVAGEWMAGVSQDISGCNDETGTIDVNTTAPRTDYNLYLVLEADPDVRADDSLLLGTVNSRSDPTQRPSMVDRTIPFTRRADTP